MEAYSPFSRLHSLGWRVASIDRRATHFPAPFTRARVQTARACAIRLQRHRRAPHLSQPAEIVTRGIVGLSRCTLGPPSVLFLYHFVQYSRERKCADEAA